MFTGCYRPVSGRLRLAARYGAAALVLSWACCARRRRWAAEKNKNIFCRPLCLGSGKTPVGKIQQRLQPWPVKTGARVLFASGGHMLVPSHMGDGVAPGQGLAQRGQRRVLGRLKGLAFQAFKFYADRVVVAVV